MLKLPKPSRTKKKAMGKISRPETVNTARNIGRHDAVKKRFVSHASYDMESYNTAQKHDSCIEGKERKENGRTLLRPIGAGNVLTGMFFKA
jgi:hypothetical protein